LGAVCAIRVIDRGWPVTGGYASFHHASPLYWATPIDRLDFDSVAFKTVVYDRAKPPGTAGYVDEVRFWRQLRRQRHGPCSPEPMTNISTSPRH